MRPDPLPAPTGPTQPSPPPTNPPPTNPPPTSFSSPRDNILIPTGVLGAHGAGFTGGGVKIAVLDSGANPDLGPLKGKDLHFLDADGSASTPVDTGGHGSIMAMVLGGNKADGYLGGVAPDADLYVSRVCAVAGCSYSSDDFDKRVAQGVRLFNASWGGLMPASDGSAQVERNRQIIVDSVRQATINAVNAGALLVFPTGNKDGVFAGGKMDYGNPDGLQTDVSLTPHWFPELQKGWLAVTNVAIDGDQWNTTSGKVTGLSDTAVACNDAANWCLAAPGFVQTVPVPGGEWAENAYAVGTSDSTAIVTGVAALVWQSFPWMSADNVRQTVLTTATHLGDGAADKPNPVYGWGLVNAEKAVKGPAKFDAAIFGATFNADVGAYNSVFANPIAGDGGLTLNGNGGSLTLAAANSYTGPTNVQSGTLVLAGSVTSNVAVAGAGQFAGNGTVHGNVANDGVVLSVSDVPGKGLVITGDYTAGASSTTAVAMGAPLTVGGTASLDGRLYLPLPIDKYTPKATETLISAGSVNGTFVETTYASGLFYTASLKYGATEVAADLTRTNVAQSQAAALPVPKAAAQGVESALQQADQWSRTDYAGHQSFLDHAALFMSAQSEAVATSSLASIGGEAYGTLTAIEAAQSQHIDNSIALRQNGVLPGEHVGLWTQAYADNGGIAQAGYASAKYRGEGWLFGLDIPVTDVATAGVFAGQYRMNADMAALAGHVDSRDTVVGAYGRWDFTSGAYLAARASWDHANLNVRRTLDLGGTLLPTGGERTDGIGRATFEFGQTFGAFTPYVSASYLRVNSHAFTESGDSGFGLTAPSQRHSATLANLGVRYSTGFAWAGGDSTLAAYADFQHVLSGGSTDFTAALTGAPTATFTATGQEMTPNLGRVGATFSTRINDQWDWFVGADVEGGSHRAHGFGANAGARVRF